MSSPNSLPFDQIARVSISNAPLVIILLALAVALTASFISLSPKFSGLSAPRSILAFACTWLGVMATGIFLARSPSIPHSADAQVLKLAEIVLLFAIGVPFAIRLYMKWIGGNLTAAESAGGAVAVRAWLSFPNVAMAVVMAVMMWRVFDYPLILMLMFTFGLLLIFPATHGLGADGPALEAAPDTGGNEREKVLAMLENGRITAEESTDLLNALAASQPAAIPPAQPLSPARRLMLTGSCVVLAGFFFPWITIDPGKEVARTMHSMQQGFGENFPLQLPEMALPQLNSGLRVSAVGSEIEHGLGWMILALALAAALLPLFAKSLDRATLRLMQMLALGVGTVILLSVVSSGIRWVSFGLVAAIAGYFIEWIGLLRERTAA